MGERATEIVPDVDEQTTHVRLVEEDARHRERGQLHDARGHRHVRRRRAQLGHHACHVVEHTHAMRTHRSDSLR